MVLTSVERKYQYHCGLTGPVLIYPLPLMKFKNYRHASLPPLPLSPSAIAPIRLVAELLVRKMQKMNHGRQFMSAHLRRGDCKSNPNNLSGRKTCLGVVFFLLQLFTLLFCAVGLSSPKGKKISNDLRLFFTLAVVAFGWSPQSSIEGHLAYAKEKLEPGRHLLDKFWKGHDVARTVDVPGIVLSTFFNGAPPPLKNDK